MTKQKYEYSGTDYSMFKRSQSTSIKQDDIHKAIKGFEFGINTWKQLAATHPKKISPKKASYHISLVSSLIMTLKKIEKRDPVTQSELDSLTSKHGCQVFKNYDNIESKQEVSEQQYPPGLNKQKYEEEFPALKPGKP